MARTRTAEEAKATQAAALADWEAGNVNKEFSEKQWERNVSDKDVERTLKGKSVLICRFTWQELPRFGFWHPQVKVVIIWQPAESGLGSELKSCIVPKKNGPEYLQRQSDFEPVRWEDGD
jgi:hypothetical protein